MVSHSREEHLVRGYRLPVSTAGAEGRLQVESVAVPTRGHLPATVDFHAPSKTLFWIDSEYFEFKEPIPRSLIRSMPLDGTAAPSVIVETCI